MTPEPQATRFELASILVVDDEKVIRDGCERVLTKAGHRVTTASDGQQALDLIGRQAYDLLLLDIKMPGLDGLQVLKALQQEQSELLVLVVTGYATIETAVEAMKAGAYDLLLKPFSTDALRNRGQSRARPSGFGPGDGKSPGGTGPKPAGYRQGTKPGPDHHELNDLRRPGDG